MSIKMFLAVFLCVLFGATNLATAGLTYDAVNDFNGSNPNGAWTYLSSYNNNALLTTPDNNAVPGIQALINGFNGIPFTAAIDKNITNATVSFQTVVQPVDMLRMDGEAYNTTVQWTAPTSGVWSISATFTGIDIHEGSHNVEILKNLTTVLLPLSTINSFGAGVGLDNNFTLNAGDTISFVELTGNGGYNLSTGLSATITSVVPEPSSLILTGMPALAGLGYWLRKRFSQVGCVAR